MTTSELGHTGMLNRTQVSLMKTPELGHAEIPNRTQVSLMKMSELGQRTGIPHRTQRSL